MSPKEIVYLDLPPQRQPLGQGLKEVALLAAHLLGEENDVVEALVLASDLLHGKTASDPQDEPAKPAPTPEPVLETEVGVSAEVQ